MCNYQGYEFGARYPDSLCIDGMLYDADACDSDGNLYEQEDYFPCPMCHPFAYIARRAEYNSYGQDFWVMLKSYYYAVRLTGDIWKNRLFKTEPWRAS